ncbi:FAD-binding protein [Paroceanicella profunda]|uniref:FAD-binding protein n=2 Tax=Paroceanicella profunda TaxID=2579971 RepID=A0A5B8G143_9RHOB|nr:FAD-binding protein [Paroceanicella profunda]QDL93560.1 FAD-binding protein [Paroceanicella profunda]
MRPETEAALAECVRGARGPLCITGGGTRQALGNPVTGEALSVAGLSGITLYDPGALTLVAQAGTPLAEVEEALAAEGQMLPFEPMDHRAVLGTSGAPTVGGMVACNVSGPRRIQAGACRDSLIGIRFVNGAGAVIRNGGRVMKNVTGYDLVKLLAGSHGTLGVLTEVAFKVLPRPETCLALRIGGLDDAGAVAAMTVALGSPCEANGLVHLSGPAETWIRLEGFADALKVRAGKLAALLKTRCGVSAEIVEAGPARAAFEGFRDLAWAAGRPGDLWRLSVRPSDGPALAARLRAAGAGEIVFDWGGGLLWALAPEGTDLRPALAGPGHATLLRAGPETRRALGAFQPEAPAIAAISKALRARFDPRGILNPGRMG